jgi:hypothetical protein
LNYSAVTPEKIKCGNTKIYKQAGCRNDSLTSNTKENLPAAATPEGFLLIGCAKRIETTRSGQKQLNVATIQL